MNTEVRVPFNIQMRQIPQIIPLIQNSIQFRL